MSKAAATLEEQLARIRIRRADCCRTLTRLSQMETDLERRLELSGKPVCEHTRCAQYWVDGGENRCIEGETS